MDRFIPLTVDEFVELVGQFRFTRQIDAVHMHHTWRPNHAQWRGEDSVDAMWRYHTQVQGWSDLAQHVTIAPDGVIWTGRNWNQSPASAVGYNGNAAHGPFMFETVGDFDQGHDALAGKQREAVVRVITCMQRRFQLPLESLRFHCMMTDQKSCPGTGVDYRTILSEVQKDQAQVDAGTRTRGWTGWASRSFTAAAGRVGAALRSLERRSSRGVEPSEADLPEQEMSASEIALVTGIAGATRAAPGVSRDGRRDALTPNVLAALRPHVINLNQGRFSGEGRFRTDKADVDAIFAEHLEQALRTAAAENPPRPLRILFWAHGGLIDEASGLWIAHQQIEWWKKNQVYPIHFVWETGFGDALRQILAGTRGAVRDLADVSDAAVERLVRVLGGEKIWSAMKRSAELAVAPDGGARYVAEKLHDFVTAHPEIELHAVGHSAGSIFHAHFLPTAFDLGVPAFRTLQFLAPAIRSDLFTRQLLGRVGSQVRDLTMFTMARDWEEADDVVGMYRKSLLYLIYHALEPERETPILGLEVCVRQDRELTRLFGLDGQPSSSARVIWAVTQATTGRSASTSQTHGGFDNDRATMDGVASRIRDADVAVSFPDEAIERGLALWEEAVRVVVPPPVPTPLPPGAPSSPSEPSSLGVHIGGGGRRRALCIGINAYPSAPLYGCVADAEEWAATLGNLGFDCARLFDDQARRTSILDALHDLIATSRSGDVVVLQYSGHGTHLDDLDGDETDGQDEALCPYDIDAGAFLLDDDVAALMAAIPDGVNVTCFFDCCHSGTTTRFMVGPPVGHRDHRPRRARFLPPTATMQAAHRSYRARAGAPRPIPGRDAATMRNVAFAACADPEVAWEDNGHGEFTVRATRLLRAGVAGITNEEFQRRVTADFGPQPRQNPRLDCAPAALGAQLLAPLTAPAGRHLHGVATNGGRVRGAEAADLFVAQALRRAADAITARR